jgi:hypothetical protein
MIVRRKSDKTYVAFKVTDNELPALLREIADTVRIDSLNGGISLAWGHSGHSPDLICKDPATGEMAHYDHFAEEGQYVLFGEGEASVVDAATFAAVYEPLEEPFSWALQEEIAAREAQSGLSEVCRGPVPAVSTKRKPEWDRFAGETPNAWGNTFRWESK